ncbi:MAG: YopX family protein [Candidatus Njordarchaeia archaeon]
MCQKARGKRKDNREWVYGWLIQDCEGNYYILTYLNNVIDFEKEDIEVYEVIPETIGYFIGLYDKPNKEIYDGDILMRDRRTIFTPDAEPQLALVYYDINEARFWIKERHIDLEFFNMQQLKEFEIIGNKTDNPELLDKIL